MKRNAQPPAPTPEEIRAHTRKLIGRKLRRVLQPIRTAARELGYAIAVHGSLSRDIDLVAVPWTQTAACAQDLAARVFEVARERNGDVGFFAKDDMPSLEVLTGEKKPHGRRAWSFHLGGTYIDLSVMPRHA